MLRLPIAIMVGNVASVTKIQPLQGGPTIRRFVVGELTDYDATNISLKEGEWYYLVYLFDSKDAKFYVDGELKQHMPAPNLNGIDVSKSPHLDIGAESGTPGNWYSHTILDELWISNIAKSEEEIKALASPESILSVSLRDKLATTWGTIKATGVSGNALEESATGNYGFAVIPFRPLDDNQ